MEATMKASRRGKAPKKADDTILREHLLNLLLGRGAHADFEKAIADLPASLRGARHPNLPFTLWRLLEHMRIAQWDILELLSGRQARITGLAQRILAEK